MRILAIGDIVGLSTLEYIKERLWRVRTENSIDLTVANGENTNDVHGLGADEAEAILSYGVDVITGGNHTFSRKDIYSLLENSSAVIRPSVFQRVSILFIYAQLSPPVFKQVRS